MKLTLVKSVNGNNKHSKARKHCIFWNTTLVNLLSL